MSGTGILPHSALAATNHDNRIRVYFQAYNGYLRESGFEEGHGWTTKHDHLPTPVKPKTFTPIACVSHGNLSKIHVFYLDIHYMISEIVYDGHHWVAGELNKHKFTAASYSQLAAVQWDDEIRVYYQKADDNRIYELLRSGSHEWGHGQGTKQEAEPGSRLAAIRTADKAIRVYYQAPNNHHNVTLQVSTEGNWAHVQDISPPVESPPHGPYAAITFGQSDIRVYFQKVDSKLYEAGGSGHPSIWRGGSSPLADFIPQTFLASVTWGNISNIRVYGQSSGDTVQEVMWIKDKGWSKGSIVPTK